MFTFNYKGYVVKVEDTIVRLYDRKNNLVKEAEWGYLEHTTPSTSAYRDFVNRYIREQEKKISIEEKMTQMIKIQLNNDQHITLKQVDGTLIAYHADSSDGEIISATEIDEQLLFEFLCSEFDWYSAGKAMELAVAKKEEQNRNAEIIKEYVFGDYKIENLYKFLPATANLLEEEKRSVAESLLTNALRAGYSALVKQEGLDLSEDEQEYTMELCSKCGHDQCIPADRESLCPECGEIIYPCSMCDEHDKCGGDHICFFKHNRAYYERTMHAFWEKCLNEAEKKIRNWTAEQPSVENIWIVATANFNAGANAEQLAGYYINFYKDAALKVWLNKMEGAFLSKREKEIEKILKMLC